MDLKYITLCNLNQCKMLMGNIFKRNICTTIKQIKSIKYGETIWIIVREVFAILKQIRKLLLSEPPHFLFDVNNENLTFD